MDLITWSRIQFAMTAAYHWLFVPLTLGLALVMAIMETLYVVKKDDFWRKTAKFWMKVFAVNFAVGIATGLILAFEFGMKMLTLFVRLFWDIVESEKERMIRESISFGRWFSTN